MHNNAIFQKRKPSCAKVSKGILNPVKHGWSWAMCWQQQARTRRRERSTSEALRLIEPMVHFTSDWRLLVIKHTEQTKPRVFIVNGLMCNQEMCRRMLLLLSSMQRLDG